MTDEIKISWQEIDDCADLLADKIRPKIHPHFTIDGIANGGIIPAVLIAKRLLDLDPHVGVHRSVGVNHWSHNPRHPNYFRRFPDKMEVETHVIVDDIADKGITFLDAMDSLGIALGCPDTIFVTFYRRSNKCPPIPNHVWAVGIETDGYLVFPWETREELGGKSR